MLSRKTMWIAAAIGAVIIVWLGSLIDDVRPRFVPVSGTIKIPASNWVSYPFLNSRVIQTDKMWVSTYGRNGTNFSMYLVDLQARKVIGQLKNADPICFDETGTQLLCSQGHPRTWSTNQWIRPIATLILKVFHRRNANATDQPEIIWLLNIRNNDATALGRVEHFRGTGSTTVPSPDLRRAYAQGTAEPGEILLCDLPKKNSRRVTFAPSPCGWWDDHTILGKTANTEFVLYDVLTNGSRVLVDRNTLAPWLQHAPLARSTSGAGAGITWSPEASPFAVWNGRENDFYVTDHVRRWGATNSFLLKMERSSGSLTTISTNFQFGWGDAFSADGKYYVYSSTNSRTDNSGVFVRELTNNITQTLVAPNGGRTYSSPRFYRDGVIFLRSNGVHFIKLNETESVQLFP